MEVSVVLPQPGLWVPEICLFGLTKTNDQVQPTNQGISEMGQGHEGLVRADCTVGKDRQTSPDINSGKAEISWRSLCYVG